MLGLPGCATVSRTPTVTPTADVEQQLIEADRAFARAAAERGIEGWVSYFTPDAVRSDMGGGVFRGLQAIREHDGPMFANPAVRLEWDPTDAGVFEDGRHGFTRGRYEIVLREGDGPPVVLSRGSYLSIWRLDEGGWKVILDTGSPDAG
jgi:ketosteroid isomerase-like protein